MDRKEAFRAGVLDWVREESERHMNPFVGIGGAIVTLACRDGQGSEQIPEIFDTEFNTVVSLDGHSGIGSHGERSVVTTWVLRERAATIRRAIQNRMDQADDCPAPEWVDDTVKALENVVARTTAFIEPIVKENEEIQKISGRAAQQERERRARMTPEERRDEDFREQWKRNHPWGRNFY